MFDTDEFKRSGLLYPLSTLAVFVSLYGFFLLACLRFFVPQRSFSNRPHVALRVCCASIVVGLLSSNKYHAASVQYFYTGFNLVCLPGMSKGDDCHA